MGRAERAQPHTQRLLLEFCDVSPKEHSKPRVSLLETSRTLSLFWRNIANTEFWSFSRRNIEQKETPSFSFLSEKLEVSQPILQEAIEKCGMCVCGETILKQIGSHSFYWKPRLRTSIKWALKVLFRQALLTTHSSLLWMGRGKESRGHDPSL